MLRVPNRIAQRLTSITLPRFRISYPALTRRSIMTLDIPPPVDTTSRLAKLRELMKGGDNSVQAYIVPSEDQHFSEYVAICDRRRAFISGFTGSAGTAVITLENAFLFTDGRYFLQAEKELDKNWTLMKMGIRDVPTWKDFLSKKLDKGIRIGVDPTLTLAEDAKPLKESLEAHKSSLVSLKKNLVDVVWAESRPSRPKNKVYSFDVKYAGESSGDKIAKLREEMTKQNAKAVVISMLDEVAWLFNLRGSDVEHSPVFFAYAVITHDTQTLFVDPSQVDDTVRGHLGKDIELLPYDSFFDHLRTLPTTLQLSKNAQVILDKQSSLAVAEAIGNDNYTIVPSLVAHLKTIKNTTEVEGFRQSHIRDGAALVRYFAWLEEQLNDGKEVTETGGADVLEKYRSEQDLFQGLSFSTISSTGPNAAIIHYHPDPVNSYIIKRNQVYLCDSGAQYLDGTTDVTRTLHFGTPTTEEKRAFTRVLQGHIAIDMSVFPRGTTGAVLDGFARCALWSDGLDYRHGTGHGVGHFLNVHEGPQGIVKRVPNGDVPLKPGMTLSNEPGYYEDEKFGIRIESIVVVKEATTANNFGGVGFLGFEHVTMCPIQTKLVDKELLLEHERKWLNAYHAEVLEKVSPLLHNDTRALEWLRRECAPI